MRCNRLYLGGLRQYTAWKPARYLLFQGQPLRLPFIKWQVQDTLIQGILAFREKRILISRGKYPVLADIMYNSINFIRSPLRWGTALHRSHADSRDT